MRAMNTRVLIKYASYSTRWIISVFCLMTNCSFESSSLLSADDDDDDDDMMTTDDVDDIALLTG